MTITYVKPESLLRTRVNDYIPSLQTEQYASMVKRPMFSTMTIRDMLVDPRCNFGLWLIKGPILSKGRFKVECENEEVTEFVVRMINDFWMNGAIQAMKAIEWGHSGSEVIYKRDEESGRITYKCLKDFDPPSCRVVTKHGNRTGIIVDNFLTSEMQPGAAVYLGGPKCFHHVHWRHIHPFYGRSRFYGAHIPWNEIWSDGGYRDIRRLWFHKNAFEGGTIYHPMGRVRLPDGRVVEYQDLAQEIVEKKRSGAVLTLPSDTNASGQRTWEHIPGKGNTIPAGLFDYGDSLRIEILEAMGIPYEVIEASGNEGFGSSTGRAIPETAFYSILQEELNWLIFDFTEQIIKPMIQINAALGMLPFATVRVLAFPLESSTMAAEEGSQMPEDEEPDQSTQGGKKRPTSDSGKPGGKGKKSSQSDDKPDDAGDESDQPMGAATA